MILITQKGHLAVPRIQKKFSKKIRFVNDILQVFSLVVQIVVQIDTFVVAWNISFLNCTFNLFVFPGNIENCHK